MLKLLLQSNSPIVQRAFETSPDTVYGILVAALLLAVIFLATGFLYLAKQVLSISTDASVGLNATADGMERLERSIQLLEFQISNIDTIKKKAN
jgi:hypothetical protein